MSCSSVLVIKKIKAKVLGPEFKKQIKELFRDPSQRKYISALYELATRDEKTGLYSNKFFESVLAMELEKAERGYQKLCLFIIDIDFFKKINDTYGHLKADTFLKRLADILKKRLRRSDIAARFGGEEFFILLPETDLERAKLITARLREAIKSDRVLKRYKLTVSGGLTAYRQKDTSKSLMERADQGLYKAKESGRDRFVAME